MFGRPAELRSRLLALALVTVAAACVSLPEAASVRTVPTARFALPTHVRVRVAGRVRKVALEEYVIAAALSELTPVGEAPDVVRRVYEVQTILARTYAVSNVGRHASGGFDFCDGTHCQLYQPARLASSRFAAVARLAESATRGRIVTYANRIARTTFHADCGGHTGSAHAVWTGGPFAYLTGAPDDVPEVSHRTWQFAASADQLRRAINDDRDASVGSRLRTVRVSERDGSGRAVRIELVGDTRRALGGERFRALVNAAFGDRAIQSTRFTVSASGSGYRFDGTGFGHGVGLCQAGALARARRGQTTDAILASYFPGTKIEHSR
jgi:stage II sporulation protein D